MRVVSYKSKAYNFPKQFHIKQNALDRQEGSGNSVPMHWPSETVNLIKNVLEAKNSHSPNCFDPGGDKLNAHGQ